MSSPSCHVTALATPRVHARALVCQTAILEGDVEVGRECSIWHYAVLRADFGPIRVGAYSNIQEHVTIHMSRGFAVDIGELVSVGHGAMLHGCSIASRCIIGMRAVLLNGVRIGAGSIVAAGSVIPAGDYPPNSLIIGKTVVRQTTDGDRAKIMQNAAEYCALISARNALAECNAPHSSHSLPRDPHVPCVGGEAQTLAA